MIVYGLGKSEEIRRGGLEGGGEFPLGVLHAGGQTRIEVEPADEDGERLAGALGRKALHDHVAVRVQIVDQFAALAPGDPCAGDGDGGDALVDLKGEEVGTGLGRQFQTKAALEIGVPGAGLD
nr:hypothetical protein [Brevundimonas naejangsanensis]